ncbi:MAG: sodium:solute symporter [Verrucomicrobiota bacterium]
MPPAESSFHPVDWTVLVAYFAATMGIGFYFYRRTRSVEGYAAANRSLPGWVCGLSILATYVSSISYLALPGKSFAGNWNAFAFSLSIPIVAIFAVRYFLPYYRKSGAISAYELLENRFGLWARVFTSSFYLLFHIARIAVVLYLMALPMQVIFGWDIHAILIVTGICVTVYSLAGGLVAVIWTDAIQAIVLMVGAVVCLFVLLAHAPGGAAGVMEVAAENEKFSLGSFALDDFATATFWVIFLFGIADNFRNFGIDQSYIQRYIASKSDRAARRSLWMGSLLYIPVSALFFFIGTVLFSYYGATGAATDAPGDLQQVEAIVAKQKLLQEGVSPSDPEFAGQIEAKAAELELADLGDRVFPHFIAHSLPPGLTGLLIAAVFAAAMSTVSTSLNSSATLIMNDYYRRFFNANAPEKKAMRVLYAGTILWGIFGTGLAIFLVEVTQSALDIWWVLSGIIGGGMTGLFLLGLINRRAGNTAAVAGLCAGIVVIAWISWPKIASFMGQEVQPVLHVQMAPVLGVLIILVAGSLIAAFAGTNRSNDHENA